MGIKRVKGGYKVHSKKTGRPLSKKAKTKKGAQAQERAIQASKARRRKK